MKINQTIFLLSVFFAKILWGVSYNIEEIYAKFQKANYLVDIEQDIPLAIVAPYMDQNNKYQNFALFIDAYYFYMDLERSKAMSNERIFNLCLECMLNKKEIYDETDNLNNLWAELEDCINMKLLKDRRDFFWRKAQEAVTYYNDNGEWPYDDYVGGYTVEDFLNEEDSEEVEELRAANDIENIVPMSESGSDSAQDSMKNSKEVSPEKGNPQSRISDFNSNGLMEME